MNELEKIDRFAKSMMFLAFIVLGLFAVIMFYFLVDSCSDFIEPYDVYLEKLSTGEIHLVPGIKQDTEEGVVEEEEKTCVSPWFQKERLGFKTKEWEHGAYSAPNNQGEEPLVVSSAGSYAPVVNAPHSQDLDGCCYGRQFCHTEIPSFEIPAGCPKIKPCGMCHDKIPQAKSHSESLELVTGGPRERETFSSLNSCYGQSRCHFEEASVTFARDPLEGYEPKKQCRKPCVDCHLNFPPDFPPDDDIESVAFNYSSANSKPSKKPWPEDCSCCHDTRVEGDSCKRKTVELYNEANYSRNSGHVCVRCHGVADPKPKKKNVTYKEDLKKLIKPVGRWVCLGGFCVWIEDEAPEVATPSNYVFNAWLPEISSTCPRHIRRGMTCKACHFNGSSLPPAYKPFFEDCTGSGPNYSDPGLEDYVPPCYRPGYVPN